MIEEITIKEWNNKYKIGMLVKYYPIKNGVNFRLGKTTSEAWDICGTPCVLVDCCSGGVALNHLEIIKEKK